MDKTQKLIAFCEVTIIKSGFTKWPTIREAAKKLRMSQKAILKLIYTSEVLNYEGFIGDNIGDHFVTCDTPIIANAYDAMFTP